MATNKNILLIAIVVFGLLNLQFQCNKRLDCATTVYNFEIGIKAYPNKDSINVGDTIWFEVNEPTTLKDFQTGRIINYSGAENLGSVISFHQLSPLKQFTVKAADKFEYILQKGIETNALDPGFERQYVFSEENQHYVFKLGLIAKGKGTFGLIISNAANVYRNSDKCTKASFALNFKETDQHYYLNPNFQGGPTPVGGDYYFKVY